MSVMVIAALIALSAFFSASETAISSVNRIRLKNMAENGSKGAQRTLNLLKKYDKALTTILIGNNIVNIAASSISTVLCVQLVGEKYGSLTATVATTLVVLIFGEITPKCIAKDHAEGFCIAVSGIIRFLTFVFTPISVLFMLLKSGLSRIFRKKDNVTVTEEELLSIIDEIEDEGVLEQQESDLVRSALQFDEITAAEIITPRVRITAVDVNDSAEEVRAKFLSEEYSRMPVFEKNIDSIIGIINQKDFIKAYDRRGGELSVRELMQDTIYVPSMQKISVVLRQMQKKKCHMSVVLDQHGGTLGIVTMEDLLEELVGEIWDESDEVRSPVTMRSERQFAVYGDVSLGTLRRYFSSRDIDFQAESEAHTVAGWTLELFGMIPEEGDKAETDEFCVTVLDAGEKRVKKVLIELKEKENSE